MAGCSSSKEKEKLVRLCPKRCRSERQARRGGITYSDGCLEKERADFFLNKKGLMKGQKQKEKMHRFSGRLNKVGEKTMFSRDCFEVNCCYDTKREIEIV